MKMKALPLFFETSAHVQLLPTQREIPKDKIMKNHQENMKDLFVLINTVK
jgi:hypothetical protein